MSSTDFVFDKFLRTCDICGTPRKASELTIRDNVAICIRHPGFRTSKELDKLNARQKVPIAPLRTTARPLSSLETWEVEEGKIFDLVTSVAPFETFNTTGDGAPGVTGVKNYGATGWSCVYLYALITENKRPAAWIAQAKAKLAALADFLVAIQTPTSAGDWTVGGFDQHQLNPAFSRRSFAGDAGVCCMALCRAYQVTGALKYLDAAKAAAAFIVVLQSNSLASFDANFPFYGPPANYWDGLDMQYSRLFLPGDLVCLWALSVLKGIAGDILLVAPDPAAFTADPSRLISASMSQMQAFWTTGFGGVNGLSAATPRPSFDYSTATWNTGAVTTAGWATGLRSLYEVSGATAQVQSCNAYLLALAQSTATKVPAGASQNRILTGVTGTFDPTLAPPSAFNPAAIPPAETGGFYDYASAGLLAPLAARAALDSTKAAIGTARRRTAEGSPRDGRTQYLGRLGMSGYSFQPYATFVPNRQESVTRAAQTGLLYRVGMTGMGSH